MDFRVIKEKDLFYLSAPDGNVSREADRDVGYGLFTRDTRVLSHLVWSLGPMHLILLCDDDSENCAAVYQYTNDEWADNGQVKIGRETLFVTRRQFVDGKRFYEQGTVQNNGFADVEFSVSYDIDADFKDMFVVRGFPWHQKPEPVGVEQTGKALKFHYCAKDDMTMTTTCRLVVPDDGTGHGVEVNISELTGEIGAKGGALDHSLSCHLFVPAHQCVRFAFVADVEMGREMSKTALPLARETHGANSHPTENDLDGVHNQAADFFVSIDDARRQLVESYRKWQADAPHVSGDKAFTQWYQRGLLDMRMLLTDVGYGPFFVAGVPWYAVPFGRDSLIAALQMLPINSDIAKGTLRTMAAFQGQSLIAECDEQPGKIMHELRDGELTRIGEVPFGPYYGSVDATPLFLLLGAEYFAWTGDRQLVASILANVNRAFDWIEQYGDRDGDGFVEYCREASKGLGNQGWKDSHDSMVHKDGSLAQPPIALCEVQAYVYAAYRMWSDIYRQFGESNRANHCAAAADRLQAAFEKQFWMDADGALALALDGEKHQVRSLASNMGHALWAGALRDEFANRVADRLLQSDLFSGFGIRTLSSSECAYNPMSYHNGSVWPHDTSIVLAGMCRYGRTDGVERITAGLLAASERMRHHRLPELFAGFGLDVAERVVPYPVSCSPQAWAAATPMMALQAILGIQPEVARGFVRLNPVLPNEITSLEVTGIHVGPGELDVVLLRSLPGDTTMAVRRNTTGLSIELGAARGR